VNTTSCCLWSEARKKTTTTSYDITLLYSTLLYPVPLPLLRAPLLRRGLLHAKRLAHARVRGRGRGNVMLHLHDPPVRRGRARRIAPAQRALQLVVLQEQRLRLLARPTVVAAAQRVRHARVHATHRVGARLAINALQRTRAHRELMISYCSD
jgi:hypothetical protein